jgi:hypothetical protein
MANSTDIKTTTALAEIFSLPTIEQRVAGACSLAAPIAHPDIEDLGRQWSGDKRKAMSNDDCMHEGGWRDSTQHNKVQTGELRSFLDGKKRLISVSSFYEHLITRIVLSYPVDGPARKGTNAATRFKKLENLEGGDSASL